MPDRLPQLSEVTVFTLLTAFAYVHPMTGLNVGSVTVTSPALPQTPEDAASLLNRVYDTLPEFENIPRNQVILLSWSVFG